MEAGRVGLQRTPLGGEIVLWAVRRYCRYGISYRDLEQMMAERGVSVDHSTIYRWVQRYAPEIEKRLRWHWRRPRSGMLPRRNRANGTRRSERNIPAGVEIRSTLGVNVKAHLDEKRWGEEIK
jgi:hypothetical protein